tara:strand:- start:957 stop:3092 length:2136 start_codon:yes stop_codon:yes gene_type:complete
MGAPTGHHYSLKSLVDQKNIQIPEYQRTYDWSKTTVEQLLDCLSEHQKLYKNNLPSNPYFLGNLMIHADASDAEGRWYLVDGQQRLVTLTILSGVVRDMLCEKEEYRKAFELQNTIIGDNSASDLNLVPRDTEKESSPKELLWPIQAPLDQEINFRFENEYNTSVNMQALNLIEPIKAKFPLAVGSEFELNPGVKLTINAPYEAGTIIQNIYGSLDLDDGVCVLPEDRLCISSDWRKTIIEQRMRFTWNKSRLIPQHFQKNIRNFLKDEMEESTQSNSEFLTDWKDIVTYMTFTTTTFDDDADAIYYFGKLNDASTSQQLNIGDLMRHHCALVVRGRPLSDPRDERIKSDWNAVEQLLKEERTKDLVPAYLSAWLTAHNDRHTERKAYTRLKKISETQFKTGSEWNKEKFSEWITSIRKGSEYFEKICFPSLGDSNHLSMKCIEGLAKQHRPLFLAGLLAFDKYNMKSQMQRLINIFEFLTIKGVEIPTIIDINGVTSQDRYSMIDKYCKELHEKSNKFESAMPVNIANSILDTFAEDVVSKCDQIWAMAEADPRDEVTGWNLETLSELKTSQKLSKLLLSRIEINEAGTSKTWASDVEVEHIAPQTWDNAWKDLEQGGAFESQEQMSDYVNWLGNRTLLDPGSNSSLSNNGFKSKQTADEHGYNVQANSWMVTRDLTSMETEKWGPEEVINRTRTLVGKIISIYDSEFLQ